MPKTDWREELVWYGWRSARTWKVELRDTLLLHQVTQQGAGDFDWHWLEQLFLSFLYNITKSGNEKISIKLERYLAAYVLNAGRKCKIYLTLSTEG